MSLLGWVWRGALVLVGVFLVVHVADFAMSTFVDRRPTDSISVSSMAWDVWFISWIAASVWSRRAAAQPALADQLMHWVPTVVGLGLLSFGSAVPNNIPFIDAPMWRLPEGAQWALTGLCAAGLLFTWWARVSLGALWSGSVSRKDDHTIVRSGPYRLVRHPIYTGLIIASFASATQITMPANMIGAVLLTIGLWLKARLEERFLSTELGADAYADYRRRTPMLISFWPAR